MEIWKKSLPYKTGYTIIYQINKDKGLLINTGLCIKNGYVNKYCKPYYSVFDLNNGDFTKSEKLKNSDFISHIDTINNRKLLTTDNGIIEFEKDSLKDLIDSNELVPTGKAHLNLVITFFDSIIERLAQI